MLGDRLRELRIERGMSQEKLAAEINVVRQTVSKWEKGLSIPDADMIIKLSEIFGVSAGELLGEEPAKAEAEPRKFVKKGHNIMRIVYKTAFGILICYLIFVIIQAIFGLVVSVDTDVSEIIVEVLK